MTTLKTHQCYQCVFDWGCLPVPHPCLNRNDFLHFHVLTRVKYKRLKNINCLKIISELTQSLTSVSWSGNKVALIGVPLSVLNLTNSLSSLAEIVNDAIRNIQIHRSSSLGYEDSFSDNKINNVHDGLTVVSNAKCFISENASASFEIPWSLITHVNILTARFTTGNNVYFL